jgi:ubiquitin-like protein Pup
MGERVQTARTETDQTGRHELSEEELRTAGKAAAEATAAAEGLGEEVDDLLKDIDSVLEENAAIVVGEFKQEGGE